jgi:hypothetical protein
MFLATASFPLLIAASSAQADVTISPNATQNMSCSGGVCQPTANNAVLNVADLETMLATGDVTVTTTGSSAQANNIEVTAGLGWAATSLTLDVFQNLSVSGPVTVRGAGGLSILTNDGGSGGELTFSGRGHVAFKKLSGRLSLDGANFTLVKSIAMLASAVRKNPSGDFALASDYDAGKDRPYFGSPISVPFAGAFEGLGNWISRLTITPVTAPTDYEIGFFVELDRGARVSDLGLTDIVIKKNDTVGMIEGALAGLSNGTIFRSYARGSVSTGDSWLVGGLVGYNGYLIDECFSDVRVTAGSGGLDSSMGGLVGRNVGTVELSFAGGNIKKKVDNDSGGVMGGLVGESEGSILNSYATGNMSSVIGYAGGMIGYNSGEVGSSYSTGIPSLTGTGQAVGGFVGEDDWEFDGDISDSYWDVTTSGVTNPDEGAGRPSNDPGITGLTTDQLQSGLPTGFDPSIWAENADINNGLPYLLSNPPR